jgi:hypothetical protein
MSMAKLKKKLQRLKFNLRKGVFQFLPGVVHIGRRALTRRIMLYGRPWVEKQFANDADGRLAFERELLAQKLFAGRPWLMPMEERGPRTLAMPRFSDEQRLDIAAKSMNEAERLDAAQQAVHAAWEIFERGYAHRDLHAKNFFWMKGQLILTDLETIEAYPESAAPAFPESYDIVARGLPSPHSTGNMCYTADREMSLRRVLGVPFERAVEAVHRTLKDRLREESATFKTASARHVLRAERIYCSFRLPFLTVPGEEVQRNSERRFKRFGIDEKTLRGRRLLDLGCFFGAMTFESQQFQPASSLGIEYDVAKVEVARSISRFNGLKDIEFRTGDVDLLEPESLGGKFDVVFCLAINRHVKDPDHLYELLGRVTGDVLFFEGNGGTDVDDAQQRLRQAGFKTVNFLGMSDDDCLPQNNNRPLFVARRSE